MTIISIRERVAKIADLSQRDPEAAHSERDQLFEDAVRYMGSPACGCPWDLGACPDAGEVAYEVLKAIDIKLRWDACA